MPKTKDLFIHVRVGEAKKQRKCYGFRCSTGVPKGAKALEVRIQPMPPVWHSYCAEHGQKLLTDASVKIAQLGVTLIN